MSFVVGTGALCAAYLVILIFRRVPNRASGGAKLDALGVPEALSLTFTGLVAFGIISMVTTLAAGRLPGVLLELAGALAVLVAACAAMTSAYRRIFPVARVATVVQLETPPQSPPPVNTAGSDKRRAA